MRRLCLCAALAAVFLATVGSATAQQLKNSQVLQNDEALGAQAQDSRNYRWQRDDDDDDRDGWRDRRYRDRRSERWQRGEPDSSRRDRPMGDMMSGGGMAGPGMRRMMFILMDTDGDGSVSLEEFRAAHERIFKAMDTDKDGKLSMQEIQSFLRGQRDAGQQQRRQGPQ